MIQVRNGESRQKGGRKGKGGRTQKMKVGGRSIGRYDEHRGKNEPLGESAHFVSYIRLLKMREDRDLG